jgi:uncharacterized surface protein with fasciclin (FAS1) repeats
MRNVTWGLIVAALSIGLTGTSAQEKTVMVGGAAMYPSRDIVDNAVHSKDHTTLVTAVKAAGLVDTLKGPGPFTVFAPTNAAFDKLPKGTVDTLLKPESMGTLKAVLTYHVVAGTMDAATLTEKAKANGGTVELSTVSGGKLWAVVSGGTLTVRDEKKATARVTIPDVRQSNGVIHVVDTVLMPK